MSCEIIGKKMCQPEPPNPFIGFKTIRHIIIARNGTDCCLFLPLSHMRVTINESLVVQLTNYDSNLLACLLAVAK